MNLKKNQVSNGKKNKQESDILLKHYNTTKLEEMSETLTERAYNKIKRDKINTHDSLNKNNKSAPRLEGSFTHPKSEQGIPLQVTK